jgi:ribose transport system substrate-binding protein
MARRVQKIGIGAAAFAMSIALAACSSGSNTDTGATTGASSPAASSGGSSSSAAGTCKYKVGYSDPTSAQEIDKIQDEVLIAYGKTIGICVTVLDAALDVNKQLADVNQFVAQKMDAIIVFPLSPDSLNAALGKAQSAGIKTIGTSAIVADAQPTGPTTPYDALYDQNSDVGGAKMLADYVNQKLGGKGNLLGIGLGFPVPSLKFMVENYQKFMTAASPNYKWLATVDNPSDDIAGAQKVAGQAVTRFHGQKIDAVMAYNTSSGVGAYQALKSSGQSGTLIAAQNGDQIGVDAISNGQIDVMTDLVPWRSAMQIMDLTQQVLEGKDVPKLTFGRLEIYDKSTIGTRLDWNKAVDQIKAGTLTCAKGGGCPSAADAAKPY